MSYTPQVASNHYASPPPAPPPKQSDFTTSFAAPPRPPPPPGQPQAQGAPSELDASYSQQSQTPTQPLIPVVEPDWLPPGLIEKSTQDLHDLLSNPSLQTALLTNPTTTHPSIPAAESLLIPLATTNTSLTSTLTTQETRLTTLRNHIQTRLLSLRALEQQHRTKIADTEAALQDFSPQALYARLSASVHEQEQLLKVLEESWLEEEDDGVGGGGGGEGKVATEREVGEFVRRVKEARRVAFLRAERRDRWDKGRVGGWR